MKRAGDPVSASELGTFMRCERLWAAKYRWPDWPRPRGQTYFQVGTKFHGLCEAYWKTGTMPADQADPISEMFTASLPHLPAPLTHRKIEERDTFTFGNVPFLVIADWVGQDRVVDLKTSKDPKRYGVWTLAQKLADPQTVLYAFRYLPHGGVFSHIYARKHRAVEVKYESKPNSDAPIAPQAYNASQTLTRPEISNAFTAVMLPPATKLYALRNKHAKIDPLTLPLPPLTENPRDSACEQYGGCEYKGLCFPRGDFRRANLTETKDGVTLRPSDMEVRVKFKIQQKQEVPVEQVQVSVAGTVLTPTDEGPVTKKFSPFKKQAEIMEVVEPKPATDVEPVFVPEPIKVDNLVELMSPAVVELEESPLPVESLVNISGPDVPAEKLFNAQPSSEYSRETESLRFEAEIGRAFLALVRLLK